MPDNEPVGGEEYVDKGNKLRSVLHDTKKRHLMFEGELTQEQRESEQPIGIKDGKSTYRMYRCICSECGKTSCKLPYSGSLKWAVDHNEQTGHAPIKHEGGVFFKEDLYK